MRAWGEIERATREEKRGHDNEKVRCKRELSRRLALSVTNEFYISKLRTCREISGEQRMYKVATVR